MQLIISHQQVTSIFKIYFSVKRVLLLSSASYIVGGFGMNSGIVDVHNLMWKLYHAEKKVFPRDILATYTIERRLAALQNAVRILFVFETRQDMILYLGT